jgi:hypothetical protein
MTRHVEQQGKGRTPTSAPRFAYEPHKLSQRLSDESVTAILDAYRAGATTGEIGERLHLAHSSINKLLRQHGVKARRHRSRGAQSTAWQSRRGWFERTTTSDPDALLEQ